MRLDGRSAIVTGGASGIGRAIACLFAREGAAVTIADLRADPVEGGTPTADVIREAGGKCAFWRCDVSSWADLDALVSEVVSAEGRLDIMVNSAANWATKPLTEVSEAEWDSVMAVSLKGVFLGCKRAVQQMLTQAPRTGEEARGRIVNISSQHGMICCPGDIAYGTAKAGVVYMTRQIAVDYAPLGVVCNAVAPGKIVTGASGISTDPERLAYAEARTPWPRLGRPEDVAKAALFLATAEASYLTGVNLLVDGGWMAG